MANYNPPKDPDIAAKGVNTRFGGPNAPSIDRTKQKPGSVRHSHKIMAQMGVDISTIKIVDGKFIEGEEILDQIFGPRPTFAQLAAIVNMKKMLRGSDAALERLENATDGKLPQTNLNAELDLNDEEHRALAASARKKLLGGLVQEPTVATEDPAPRDPE